VALALAVIGIYGVLAYAVRRRQREIGVRIALGARAPDVGRMIIRRGVMLAGSGILIGLAGAVVLSRGLSSLVFGVGVRDPLVYATAAAALCFVALLASWLPARAAVRVNPMSAFREE